jgi:hypothetical protein
MSTNIPGLNNLLGQWWGTGPECYAFAASVTNAANLVFGSNPPYQISDFLAVYPKFGTSPQAIQTIALIPTALGTGYQVGDVLTPVQADSSGAQLNVISVNGSGGLTGLGVAQGGTGYQVNNGIQTAVPNVVNGTGYEVNDVLSVVQSGASGGTVVVTSVSSTGQVTGISILNMGVGYTTATGLSTIGGFGTGALVDITTGVAVTGGHGVGAQINIVSVTPYSSQVLPQAVLQLYINLATASIQQARWFEYWPMAMAWFVAHFATLYLRSEGNPGSTAQQIAVSGLEKGIIVSEAAGDVTLTRQAVSGLDGFAAWNETTYGTQLATIAKIIGMGPMYIW